MGASVVSIRPRLGRGVKALLIINGVIYLAELAYAYAVHFRPRDVANIALWFGLHVDAVWAGRIWQPVTHLFVHSPDAIFHIVFNLMVLYFFGPTLEERWGTRRFLVRYGLYGLGSAVLIVAAQLVWPPLFHSVRPPAIGASGAIAGLVAAFCIVYWRQRLSLLFIELTGRGMLILFVVIDVLRLAMGEPIAVEGHWGGMLTAALLARPDLVNPRLNWLRFRRWRLKRRLRLQRGGKSNGDSRTLH